MFSEKICSASILALERAFSRDLREYSPEECAEFGDRLSDVFGEKGEILRAYTKEEQGFVENELLMTKASYKYWSERYCFINAEGTGLKKMFPLLETQEYVLRRLGKREEEIAEIGGGGIFVNFLKGSRQVGGSTLAESILCHRATTQNNIFGLMASHEPGPKGSGYLFAMFERMYEGLPWWLKPAETAHVKNEEIAFEGGTRLWVESGKAMKGVKGQRGQIGRGLTISMAHFSELSTWELPEPIKDSFLPGVPRAARTFIFLESTAKGRNNWWHAHWKNSPDSVWKFVNIFIPWYVEMKYSEPPPVGWVMKQTTLQHAKQIEETSLGCIGKRVSPTKEQLYWWELMRQSFEVDGNLKKFLEEFGSIDSDACFQFSGSSIFKTETIERVAMQARPLAGVLEIAPMGRLR